MFLLSNYFEDIAVKELSSVEVNKLKSNQHEFNGTKVLKDIFGLNKKEFIAEYIYIDSNNVSYKDTGELTWYDARKNHPTRTEHRLYYTESSVINRSQPGDILLVGLKTNNTVLILITNQLNSLAAHLRILFGQNNFNQNFNRIVVKDIEIDQSSKETLDYLGI